MARYQLMAVSHSLPGKEAQFDTWYSRHIHDVLAWPGVVSAQRFRLPAILGDVPKWTTLAVYEIEADDPLKFQADMMAAAGTEAIPITDALGTMTVLIAEPATQKFVKAAK